MESKFNKRFFDNLEETCNGLIFKNHEAFDRKGDEVCYISEGGLQELEEQDHDLTDEEIIQKGIGESYNSILASCKERYDEVKEAALWHGNTEWNLSPEELAQDIFEWADWAYIPTYLEGRTL